MNASNEHTQDQMNPQSENEDAMHATAQQQQSRDTQTPHSENPKSETRNPLNERIRDPELLACVGLNNEMLRNPNQCMYSAGLQRMWATRMAMKLPLIAPNQLEETEAERERRDPRKAEERRQYEERESANPVPLWRTLSGITPDNERGMSPDMRRRCLRELLDAVAFFARREIEIAARNPDPYHSQNWDPLREICFHFGIAYSKLTSYCKELTGLAAYEIIDRFCAEKLKARIRAKLDEFLRTLPPEFLAQFDSNLNPANGQRQLSPRDVKKDFAYAIWKELRAARRSPEFHRGQAALELGFANHMRLYRACLMYYRLAPSQLEFEVIKEFVDERAARNASAPPADSANYNAGFQPAPIGEADPAREETPESTSAQAATALVDKPPVAHIGAAGETPAVQKPPHVQFFTDAERMNELIEKMKEENEAMAQSA